MKNARAGLGFRTGSNVGVVKLRVNERGQDTFYIGIVAMRDKDLNLSTLASIFADEDKARAFLESKRWT